MPFPESLTALLACPECKEKLDVRELENRCVCGACKLAYPIEGGIPMLLTERAASVG